LNIALLVLVFLYKPGEVDLELATMTMQKRSFDH